MIQQILDALRVGGLVEIVQEAGGQGEVNGYQVPASAMVWKVGDGTKPFHDLIRVLDKYGIVPEEVYTGRPNGESNHNHSKLDTAMKKYIHGLLKQGKTEMNDKELQQVNDILDKYLGKVPETFVVRPENTNPEKLCKGSVGTNRQNQWSAIRSEPPAQSKQPQPFSAFAAASYRQI